MEITTSIRNTEKDIAVTEGTSSIGSNTRYEKDVPKTEEKKARDRKVSFDTNIGHHDFAHLH